jgi:hypothetical protein
MAELSPFEQFYQAYPRKKAPKDAEKAWRQVHGDEHLEAILAALSWQGPEMLKLEPCYRPYPASWLRAGRWMDEPDVPVQVVKSEFEQARDERHHQALAQQMAAAKARVG